MNAIDDDLLAILRSLWDAKPLNQPEIEQRARELLLDTIGCAISGFHTPEVASFVDALAAADSGTIRIPSMTRGLSTNAFMFAFSAAACCFEGPEGLAIAHGRPGLHVVPAVLAYALAEKRTLRDTLDALVIGYEIGGRLGSAYSIRPGMHVDGTWGTFGAAVALARLIGLKPGAALDAVNHAACQLPFSLYFPIPRGSAARNVYVGHGAVLASLAVAAAKAGLGGPRESLAEHTRLLLGEEIVLSPRKIDADWLIMQGYLKKYPITKHVHYGICAAAQWHEQRRASVKDIEKIRLRIYREAVIYCGMRGPASSIQAQFSLSYGLAWALLHGGLTVAAFSPEALADPDVRRLEAMVEIEEDPALTASGKRAASLEIAASGKTTSYFVDRVPGDPEQPLDRDEIVEKFSSGAVPAIGAKRAKEIAWRLLDGPLDAALTFAD